MIVTKVEIQNPRHEGNKIFEFKKFDKFIEWLKTFLIVGDERWIKISVGVPTKDTEYFGVLEGYITPTTDDSIST